MSIDKTLEELLSEQPADVVAAADRRLLELVEEAGVSFVREALGKTQQHVARRLGRTQAYVSKLEHQTDMLLSTLKSYIRAAGGDLQLRVLFPGGKMTADSIGELADLQSIAVYPTPRSAPEFVCYSAGEAVYFTVQHSPEKARLVAARMSEPANETVQVNAELAGAYRGAIATYG